MILRGGAPEDEAPEDPDCFGKPRPLPQKKRAKSKNRSNSVDARRGVSREPPAEVDEANAWSGGLRGELHKDEEEPDDPDCFGKPPPREQRRRKTEAPRKAPERPPRPSKSGSDHLDGQRLGSGSGPSRPSSASSLVGRSKPPPVNQMPEALRKKMEARQDARQDQASRDRRVSRNDREPASDPEHVPGHLQDPSPRRSPGSRRSDSPEDEEPVRLPPLSGSDRGSERGGGAPRGRRCSSQPPSQPRNQVKEKKKPPRPQSVGHTKAEKDDDGEKGSRQMFDKNTLRTNNKQLFQGAIQFYRQDRGIKNGPGQSSGIPANEPLPTEAVNVFVRKRPLFEKEDKQKSDYDVLSILPGRPASKQVCLHNCLFQADLKTPFISHVTFDFDRVYDEAAESCDVYASAAQPLVEGTLAGDIGTMFMFGQTGSGKTHTMSAIQELAARDLFEGADGDEPWLSVQFVELRGNRCFDLLAPGIQEGRKTQRPELKIREQADHSYTADGACDLYPKTAEELCRICEMAAGRRATSATDANSVSSRSHAVCTIRLFQSDGQLMLVDCAGTERKKDSMYHSKERQQEGAEINASLHALKECVRYLSTSAKVPQHAYRASSLTKILADAFIRGSAARLAVICTVSPCATDSEHTLGTLRMGVALSGRGSEREEKMMLQDMVKKKPRLEHPKTWKPEQVRDWLETVRDGQFRDVADAVPSNFTGQMFVRLTESRCVQLCGDNQRRGRQLFDLIHQEIRQIDASRKGSH